MTSGLAELLNHTPKSLTKLDLKTIMGQPWGAAHQKWMKDTSQV